MHNQINEILCIKLYYYSYVYTINDDITEIAL